jgi:hypothetical protein
MNGWKKYLGAALLSAACAQAWAVPTLSITPTPASATPGSSLGVDVMVSDIADLYIYQFSLAFNASVLQAGTVSLGNFLEGSGLPTLGDPGMVDNVAGTISYTFNTLLGPEAGVAGSGLLLHIDFDTLAAGSSALNFSDLLFLDSRGNDIAVNAVNGSVTVAAAPVDVPEPATWMLVGLGAVAAATLRRRGLPAAKV